MSAVELEATYGRQHEEHHHRRNRPYTFQNYIIRQSCVSNHSFEGHRGRRLEVHGWTSSTATPLLISSRHGVGHEELTHCQ
jgi:hypothetical protein